MNLERRDSSLRLGMTPCPPCALSSRCPAERLDRLDVVEIVDPLQHDALPTCSLQLAQLCRDLSGSTDYLTFAPQIVSALAREALGKLVIVFAEDDSRHQRAANLARLTSHVAQHI